MSKKVLRFTASVPGTNTVAYASGDAFGTNITFTLPEGGVIKNAVLTDLPSAAATIDLVFSTGSTTATNNAVFAPTDAELNTVLGVVQIDTFYAFSTNSVGMPTETFNGLQYRDDGSSVVCQCVTRGAITLGASDTPQLTIYVEGD